MASKVDGDLYVTGEGKFGSMVIPTNAVDDTNFKTVNPLTCEKQYHQHQKNFSQKHTETAVAERRVIHTAYDAGTLESFRVFATVANIGDSTVTVNLYKNGSTILSSVPVLDSGDAAYTGIITGTFSATPYVANDVFEIVVTISAGTGTLAKGVNAEFISRELSGG